MFLFYIILHQQKSKVQVPEQQTTSNTKNDKRKKPQKYMISVVRIKLQPQALLYSFLLQHKQAAATESLDIYFDSPHGWQQLVLPQ